jgi:hypothetical protein
VQEGEDAQCFEEDCRSSPFIMHASSSTNGSQEGTVRSCFQFVAIGCYAAPKGCCPEVARRFNGIQFDISKRVPPSAAGLWYSLTLVSGSLPQQQGCGTV